MRSFPDFRTITKTASVHNSDNAAAVVTLAADDNERHVIRHIDASYNGNTAAGAIQVSVAGTVVWKMHITNNQERSLSKAFGDFPIPTQTGQAVVITLAASGTGGVTGNLNVIYQ